MNKILLNKVRINKGGYDDKGNYWGIGSQLYHYSYEIYNEIFDKHIRAADRETAKLIIKESLSNQYPEVIFGFYR